jgi:protoporphyrinogen oxidase
MPSDNRPVDVAIAGAGFTGLAAALELARRGHRVVVVEKDSEAGGLAGSFRIGDERGESNERLERFYHHWFASDTDILELIRGLGLESEVLHRPTRTGMYYAHQFFRLSTPLDVLRFPPLGLFDCLRLGWVALAARRVRDWQELESVTARDWLLAHCGERVYQVVWEPLLVGKFGRHADQVSAVWIWNKLKLRGGSRGSAGQEVLSYFRGGFAALVDATVAEIRRLGGEVRLGCAVQKVLANHGAAVGLATADGDIAARRVLLTTPLPISSDLLEGQCSALYLARLRDMQYLSNVCIVLELSESLSSIYWLNVNDPSFPFVAIIEHTNFEPATSYGGHHIVYLSKYLPREDRLYQMTDEEAVDFAVAALKRMFPKFERQWLTRSWVWRADYSQPIVGLHHSQKIPPLEGELKGLYVAAMGQVYPEDRGTNYAVRNGKRAAEKIATGLAE